MEPVLGAERDGLSSVPMRCRAAAPGPAGSLSSRRPFESAGLGAAGGRDDLDVLNTSHCEPVASLGWSCCEAQPPLRPVLPPLPQRQKFLLNSLSDCEDGSSYHRKA